MNADPRAQRPNYDSRFPLWAGSFAAWQDARRGYWFEPDMLGKTVTDLVGDIWCVAIAGVVTRSSWEHFARDLEEAPATAKGVLVVISSLVQQVEGFELAARALTRVSRRTRTSAHLRAAGGLALLLGQQCEAVTAPGAAPLGWLGFGAPFQNPDAILPLPINWGQWHGFDVGGCRGFDLAPHGGMVQSCLSAEALEGRGVDSLMGLRDVFRRTGGEARVFGELHNG